MNLSERIEQSNTINTPDYPSKADKHNQLNRFLSKTFHMVNNCDNKIVSWDPDGSSFVVENVEEFSKKVLPSYFNHSKFSSFVRQLNFYGFRKLRIEHHPQMKKEHKSHAVRFQHDHFRMGRPDLLRKIRRTTKSTESLDSTQIDVLQTEIDSLRDKIGKIERHMDTTVAIFKESLKTEYDDRILHLEHACKKLFALYRPPSLMLPLNCSTGPPFGQQPPSSVVPISSLPNHGRQVLSIPRHEKRPILTFQDARSSLLGQMMPTSQESCEFFVT